MNKSSAKQEKQRKLYLALGTVMGFLGYLENLARSVDNTNIECYEKEGLAWNIEHLRRSLVNVEEAIRKEMRRL